jgi:hypothetical protein
MMIRRSALVLSTLSLLVGVMLIAVVIRAQWRRDLIKWERLDQTTDTWRVTLVETGTSGFRGFWWRLDFPKPPTPAYVDELGLELGFHHNILRPGNFTPARARLGFDYRGSTGKDNDVLGDPYHEAIHHVDVPYWALVLGFLGAGLPAVRASIARRRRVRRLATGCCPSCGYDLRETTDRCPECGAVPDARTEPAGRILGRHASAVHWYVSLLAAAAVGYVFASMRSTSLEMWAAVSLVVVFLGALVRR